MKLDEFLARVVERGGSDLHLKVGSPPMGRIDGDLLPLDDRAVTEGDVEAVLVKVTERTPAKREQFLAQGDLDTAYVANELGRFRVNAFRQRGAVSFAFRFIPASVPTFKQLGLPGGVERLAGEHRGLVLVTGATGSGKSTTLAAMVDKMNRERKQHIVTIEDPIEFVHEDRGCIVNQREVGLDTESYSQALRRVLRQDPDVILIGVLRGVVSQRLLPKVGGGRVAAVEVMVNTARIADLIRDPAKTDGIPEALAEGDFHQMQTFAQHLVQLVLEELVDLDTAAAAATNRHDFEIAVQQALRRKQAAVSNGAPPEEPEPADEPADHNGVGLRLASPGE